MLIFFSVNFLLLVFSVTPFKIDQNKNQNRSIDKVQNLGNERRYKYKDPRQDSGQRNISYARYPKKRFTQIYRDKSFFNLHDSFLGRHANAASPEA